MVMTLLKERLIASLAHVPIVSIIWSCYVLYYYAACYVPAAAQENSFLGLPSAVPLSPLLLTLLSIPISLIIMQFKHSSELIGKNAYQALKFNIWLLKVYGVIILVALAGLHFKQPVVGVISGTFMLLISGLCLVQSIKGVYKAFHGGVYCYWWPGRR